jgi:hypothetical protein
MKASRKESQIDSLFRIALWFIRHIPALLPDELTHEAAYANCESTLLERSSATIRFFETLQTPSFMRPKNRM